MKQTRLILLWILMKVVRAYQVLISPLLGPRCRFYPTCSQYALEALQRYGVIIGCRLMLQRILRCHPWSKGGGDPVPQHLDCAAQDCKKRRKKQ